MSDQLNELHRQRAQAIERLAAIEREIAAELGGAPRREIAPPPARPAAVRPAAPAAEDPDAIIARFQSEARPVKADVKLGCFLYFFAALLLLFGALGLFYYLHPHK